MSSNTPGDHEVAVFISNHFLSKEIQLIIDDFIKNIAEQYKIAIYYFNIEKTTNDCISQWENIPSYNLHEITSTFAPPTLTENTIILDALFGFDITEPLSGGFSSIVKLINASDATIFSLEAPSGLFPNDNSGATQIVRANYTLLLQAPPLAWYFDENQQFFGEIIFQKKLTNKYETPNLLDVKDLLDFYKPRKRFSHKGTYGHGLLIAGSYGMAGAATLAGQAAIRSGMGLLTLQCPHTNRNIHQINIPEAILKLDPNDFCFSEITNTDDYNALAIGPGIGLYKDSEIALENILIERSTSHPDLPLILDADAINILADSLDFAKQHLSNVVLTPHPLELDRLLGTSSNSFERFKKAITFCQETKAYIILKGAYSFLISPDGEYRINTMGNSGMAKGGSGDILTGILLSLASQGYSPKECILLGSYIHGKAGDIAAQKIGEIGMTAQDLVKYIPTAWLEFEKRYNSEEIK